MKNNDPFYFSLKVTYMRVCSKFSGDIMVSLSLNAALYVINDIVPSSLHF